MTASLQFLSKPGRPNLAYVHHSAKTTLPSRPGVIFFPGYRADMEGIKALYLEKICLDMGLEFTRFDYRGHGASEGEFEKGTLSLWLEDTLAVLDHITSGPQVIVGSSMGGWLMLKALEVRKERIHGLIGIASAPDFVKPILDSLTNENKEALANKGLFYTPAKNEQDTPTPFTQAFLEDGLKNLILDKPLKFEGPLYLLHGLKDEAIHYTYSLKIMETVTSSSIQTLLIKGGDHRLGRIQDLEVLKQCLENIINFKSK